MEPKQAGMRTLIDWIVRGRFVLLPLAVALIAAAWPLAQRLAFDRSIESLYAEDDPHLESYQESKAVFGGDEFVIIGYTDPNLFPAGETDLSDKSEKRLTELAERLSEIPGVNAPSTQHLVSALEFPYRQERVKELMKGVLLGLGEHEDTTAVVLRLKPEQESDVSRGETIRRIREQTGEFVERHDALEQAMGRHARIRETSEQEYGLPVAGEPVLIHDMFRYVEQDGETLFVWSLALLGIVIFVLFFNVRWVLLPLLVVTAAVIWTEAILVLSRLKLSMVSSILNAMVTIIGIATVMHVTVHYRERRRRLGRMDSLRRTFTELLPPIFWTVTTTAVGFAAILSSDIRPMRSFALMMALGTLLVLVAAVAVLPGGMRFGSLEANGSDGPGPAGNGRRVSPSGLAALRTAVAGWIERQLAARALTVLLIAGLVFVALPWKALFPTLWTWEFEFPTAARAAAVVLAGFLLTFCRWGGDPSDTPGEGGLVAGLGRMSGWIEHHPLWFGLAPLVVAAVAGAGFVWLEVETDVSRNFRRSAPILRSLEFIEGRLGGVGSWEVNFPAPEELNEDYLDRVRELARRLREKFVDPDSGARLTKLVAVTDALDLIPKEEPLLRTRLPLSARLGILNYRQPEYLPTLYSPGDGRMRIMLRAREQQPSETKLELIRQVEQTARDWADEELREQFPDPNVEATGLFVLLAHLVQNLLRDQLVSFVLAAAGIAAMTTIAFRSLRIGLVSLLPNFFPIVLVVGTMGWIGLPVNIATAMIASVSLGLTVDGTIHYIAGYRRARQRGLDFQAAIRETHAGVGRAIVFANLALVVGFLVLTRSHFIPLVHFGVLISVAMIGGVIADLVMLPVLLRWADRPRLT